MFAAEYYFERKDYSDVAKHIYDLAVLLENNRIKEFLKDKQRLLEVIKYKRDEELNRKGGVSADIKIANFTYFRELGGKEEFKTAFELMQRIYVFNEHDMLSVEAVFAAMSELRDIMDVECLIE